MGMFGYMKELVKNSVKLVVDLGEVTQPIMDHPHVLPLLYPATALLEKGLSLF
jgi:hypothetical protein